MTTQTTTQKRSSTNPWLKPGANSHDASVDYDLYTENTLPIPLTELARWITDNAFTLYDPNHAGSTLFVFDDIELLAYVQWTMRGDSIVIDNLESAQPGCGSFLVRYLQDRYAVITLESLYAARGFWHKMGFVPDEEDPITFIWIRRCS